MKGQILKRELNFIGVIILFFLANGLYLGLKTFLLLSHFHGIYTANEASKSTNLYNRALGENWDYLELLLNKIDATRAIHFYTSFVWGAILIIGLIVRLSYSKSQTQ
jgi:hypothetical protein